MIPAINDSDLITKYSSLLKANNVPIIFSIEHLSLLLGYSEELLYRVSNSPRHFYREFEIPKKSGGMRKISEPLPTLMEIQHWLLRNIFEKAAVSKAARAYKKGNTLRGHASIHTRQSFVLRIDLKDFFSSIKRFHVQKLIFEFGYTEQLSAIIASICCLNDSLPQGGPTSPAISNIYMKKFDENLLSLCRAERLRYSRYADDLTLSGHINPIHMIEKIKICLEPFDLNINHKKTLLMRKGSRQIVTGLTVNDFVSVGRNQKRNFQQAAYYIQRFGLDGHMRKIGANKRNYLDHLIGVGGFIVHANPSDYKSAEMLRYLKELKIIYS